MDRLRTGRGEGQKATEAPREFWCATVWRLAECRPVRSDGSVRWYVGSKREGDPTGRKSGKTRLAFTAHVLPQP